MYNKQFNICFKGLILALVLSSILVYSAETWIVRLPNPSKYYKSIDNPRAKHEISENAICGLPLYWEKMSKTGSPKVDYQQSKFKSSKDFVGDIRKFNVIDFSGSTTEIVARAERKGQHAYIYADTSQSIKAKDLDEILLIFDNQIYPANIEVFGSEPRPGLDGDSLITILFYSIQQPEETMGDIAGYFWPGNQISRKAVTSSNQRKMIYIDITRLNRYGVADVSGTIAHQFQHLIHWNHDPGEEIWMNEGLSEYARFINGFRLANPPSLFLNKPDASLMNWTNHPADYARSFLWILYLAEHYGGKETVQSIVADPNPGILALQTVFNAKNPTITFEEVFSNWIVANYLDDTSDERKLYGYSSIDLPSLKPTQTFRFLPVDTRKSNVKPFTANYYLFNGGAELIVNIEGSDEVSNFRAKAIKLKSNSSPEIFDFPLYNNNGTYPLLDFGENYDQFVLIPYYLPAQTTSPFFSFEFNVKGSGGPSAFSDTVQYHDTESKTIIALGMPSQPINAEHFDSYSVRITPTSDGILKAAEFAVWQRVGDGGSVRFFVYDDSNDSLHVPVSKIDSVDIQNINESRGAITWNRVDFSSKNIPVKKGQDFHLAWEFIDYSFGDSVFVVLDTAKVATNRSSVFIREHQTWAHMSNGFNFCLKAILSIPADKTVPKITTRISHNSRYSSAINVFTISGNRLNPSSVEGTFALRDSIKLLNFHAIDSSNKVFTTDNLQLSGTGSAQLITSGRNAFGSIVGSDTLKFNVSLLDFKSGGEITSSDNNLILKLPPEAISQNIYFISYPVKTEVQQLEASALNENNFLFTGLEYTISPSDINFEKMLELTFHYQDNEIALISENDLAIAYLESEHWVVLGGELYRDKKSITTIVNRTGCFSLVVKQFEEAEAESETNLPIKFYLQQNYPNPFNPRTTIKFGLPKSTHTTIRVINLKGQIIATLLDKTLEAGEHVIEWDSTDERNLPVASGVYLYQIQAGDFIETKKLVLVK